MPASTGLEIVASLASTNPKDPPPRPELSPKGPVSYFFADHFQVLPSQAKSSCQGKKVVIDVRVCFQKLILQALCNDVSNAKHIQDVKELFEVGKLSSQNVVEAAKEALKMSFSLKEIIIIPRSPRIDDDKLAAVSDYANDCLFPLVAETADKRIKLGSVNSVPFKSEADKTDLLGLNGDRIHMRGRKGTAYYTDAIIDSILH